eukprot:TRINITY_DN952_c0_g1_i1.p1 TRINITY_DN952_c0_g1~~TRINITY_DN952_c0_g1_i1.p1  ORF type:complete len:515 (+),score=156.46 TRINITY_DN952_c0_g1_i1:81-1625(+)
MAALAARAAGDQALAGGDWVAAEDHFRAAQQAAAHDPPAGEARFFRGELSLQVARCQLRRGAAQDAAHSATKALLLLGDGEEQRPAVITALTVRAEAGQQCGNKQQAVGDYRRLETLAAPDAARAEEYAARARALEGTEVAAAPAAPGPPAAGAAGGDAEYSGCQHYHRKCKMYCPTCSMLFPCRLCHDEHPGMNHKLDRHKVNKVQCQVCFADQEPAAACRSCGAVWSEYYCDICHLWTKKPSPSHPADFIWHCDKCGICRVGYDTYGRSDYTHCENCGSCWPKNNREHKCYTGGARRDCPVCLEDLHSSIRAIEMSDCGHFMHGNCKRSLIERGQLACPLCKKSIYKANFRLIDREVQLNPMPAEFANLRAGILCNDCLAQSEVPLHWIAMKCPKCQSFNTTQVRSAADEEVQERMSELQRRSHSGAAAAGAAGPGAAAAGAAPAAAAAPAPQGPVGEVPMLEDSEGDLESAQDYGDEELEEGEEEGEAVSEDPGRPASQASDGSGMRLEGA